MGKPGEASFFGSGDKNVEYAQTGNNASRTHWHRGREGRKVGAGQRLSVAGAGEAAKTQAEAEMESGGPVVESDTPTQQTVGGGKNGLGSREGAGR